MAAGWWVERKQWRQKVAALEKVVAFDGWTIRGSDVGFLRGDREDGGEINIPLKQPTGHP
jgi:hypothetical protein